MTQAITRTEIKRRLDAREPLTLVEALPHKYYAAEHLPGAVNIPHDQIGELAPTILTDKNAFIAVYCASTECQNSAIAAKALSNMGYRKVFEYVEGKKDWMEAGLPVEREGAEQSA